MPETDAIAVSPTLSIPRDELVLRASRSSGPGGQHVNKTSSRIELSWDVAMSPSLDESQRARLRQRLFSRLDSAGQLRIVAQDERSQLRNREAAIARFAEVVAAALVVPKKRTATRVPRSAKRARLDSKKKRGALKRDRRPPLEE
jgi:ribosome-associated protein